MSEANKSIVDNHSQDEPEFAQISPALVRILGGLILLAFVSFALISFNKAMNSAIRWDQFWWSLLAGIVAQAVDAALGMAYGLTSNSLLMAFGLPPAGATATVHVAEAFTTAASGLAHWKMGNIDKRIFNRLVVPGVIGGICGVLLITSVNPQILRPIVSSYLLLMGVYIIFRAFKIVALKMKLDWRLNPLAFFGGFVDSVGGGGWGPVVTATLVGGGHEPRYVIGSVNASEFFVTLASGFSFTLLLGIGHWEMVFGLGLGAMIVTPFAAGFTRKINRKLAMILVGTLIIALSLYTIARSFGY